MTLSEPIRLVLGCSRLVVVGEVVAGLAVDLVGVARAEDAVLRPFSRLRAPKKASISGEAG